jgi:hypothetical protein
MSFKHLLVGAVFFATLLLSIAGIISAYAALFSIMTPVIGTLGALIAMIVIVLMTGSMALSLASMCAGMAAGTVNWVCNLFGKKEVEEQALA